MNTALTATYALTVLLLIATPGPVVALIVNTAATSGSRKALSTAIGTNWASLVLIAAAAWIIMTSAAVDKTWLSGMSLLGCLFIAYIAITTLREALQAPALDVPAQAPEQPGRGGLLQGFMVGISNPKDIIFFISFFPQFIQITESFGKSMVVLSLLWIAIDFAVLSLYIFAIGKIASQRSNRIITLASGIALLLIALAGLAYNIKELAG
ncbi:MULTISPECIES: LysE family translocator [Pseudomonas]|uniref:LysE family translocator n=2 Tax=Pseudomonas TaxID=286 RepID=A0AAX0W0E9_9PSED|nr:MULTISPECIES: LysE family translocator [Pseudomonas]MBH3358715.1 LysE family translocator [Pseudomonas guariconensis]MCO7623214.1 LysE family translocator [Pseudomonas guariconensis]MDM9594410.1 LysE family translocator [Pseudomonas guariconensis]MDM9607240.1 LysE family translocator [Pseudomonas guariconensis]MDM9612196.1 LysE family translocator [Pseudomonas guariconensis]